MGEMADDWKRLKEQRRLHQEKVLPNRVEYATKLLKENGHTYKQGDRGELIINGYISFWVYTGWWSGKRIGSGRGIKNLIFKLQKVKHETKG